jgi:mRNA-degrading endonuclease RelE of RelBE toxin-antitoxin system
MNNSSLPFEPKYSPQFEKKLAKLQKKDKIRSKRVLQEIQDICNSPYSYNGRFAKGRYAGKREGRAGDDRFLFIVCKQCRELGHTAINACTTCSTTKDETVVFVQMIDSHKY